MQSKLSEYLKNYFGFTVFKKGQETVIGHLLNNESAAAVFPTGAGKSLCYQLPALFLPGLTLVVSPLLALMKDQLDFLLNHNIPAARLDSTLSREAYHRILEQAKSGQIKILMISVERFKNERFRYHLEKMDISLLAIDEAHCISEWGHNFRPEYLKLPDYRKSFAIPQVLLLTATATKKVIRDIADKFEIRDENITITGFYRENLYLQVTSAGESEKKSLLFERLRGNQEMPAIIYVTLQKTAEAVSKFLLSKGIAARAYHAGMKNDEREQIQNSFIRGELNCIVATIAFGMGIDKKDIRRVIHYDVPKTIENYSQEIGRAGRDGEKAFCEVFANRDSITILENFVYGDTPEKESIMRFLEIIKANESPLLELKIPSLSRELDIRFLPLKTLIVYLDMAGIIKPAYSYFAEYSFKYSYPAEQIANAFQGERQSFVRALFSGCNTKKTWTYLDMDRIPPGYRSDRKRIIAALEYFDEKGWIELQSKQAVDVYKIINPGFNPEETAEDMHRLFAGKENREIERIHNMIRFFESRECISRKLAIYFGETIDKENCGHCSFCTDGAAVICAGAELPPIGGYNPAEITSRVKAQTGELSLHTMAKLLCGIHTPLFSRMRINKRMPEFGFLEKYPFKEVKDWLSGN